MLITPNTPRLPKKTPRPKIKWQTGNYARSQEFRFHLPYSFLLLSKLWNVTPDDLLSDFMDNLCAGSWKRKGRYEAKYLLFDYALKMNYGQEHYSAEDIRQMFTELDAIGMLWPENAKRKFFERHAKWRNRYYNWWFKKWYRKYRKPSLNKSS